jgi:hypothetical protein
MNGGCEERSSPPLKLTAVPFYLLCPRRASDRATVMDVVGAVLLPFRGRANANEPIKILRPSCPISLVLVWLRGNRKLEILTLGYRK